MADEIIRPQDIDQVLFLGENTIEVVRFNLKYPQQGAPGFSTIMYGEPYFLGLLAREKVATSIENYRILKTTPLLRGKRTLVCLADITSIDKNRSLLDVAIDNLRSEIITLQRKLNYEIQHKMLLEQFVKAQHIESEFEEWAQNKLELLKVMHSKLAPRVLAEAPEVQVSVEQQDKKKAK